MRAQGILSKMFHRHITQLLDFKLKLMNEPIYTKVNWASNGIFCSFAKFFFFFFHPLTPNQIHYYTWMKWSIKKRMHVCSIIIWFLYYTLFQNIIILYLV